jgi:hypothetical protein
MNKRRRKSLALRAILVLIVLCSLAVMGFAQQGEVKNEQKTAQAEKKITPEQAKALFASVDEILQFVSKDTGLPIKHKVKRKLATREEVEKYIEDRMKDDQDARRLERSQVVLKKFALLPQQFDLRSFMIGLLKEQVAGFYDSKTKTVYLLDWVDPGSQSAVLAHELTHALQDQNFNLDKWANADSHSGRKPTANKLMDDERMAARQAVAEGQATVVLIDYMIAPEKQSVRTNPQIADAVMEGMTSGGKTPLYIKAPMFLQQLLMFPYQYGLKFESGVLAKAGTEAAFAGAFRNPPVDTRQILEPATYLEKEQLPLMPLPEFEKAAGKEYKNYDLAALGEFDVWLLAEQYAGGNAAETLSKNWRGGYYYAALKPDVPKLSKHDALVPTSSIALAYASKWASPEAAERFAAVYAKYLPKRYQSLKDKETGAARPLAEDTHRLAGSHTWETNEGRVSIETRGDEMLVMEGFDEAAAGRITEAVFGKQ